ncbi:NAD(P)-dependent oxidoreductase [Nocardioides ungokensis]|uniref:NAD(P)-dependent oxidoreductase n=1 Tax=Nocardioides ungokensis TaxID=1643322 RepID=UPI003CCCAC71
MFGAAEFAKMKPRSLFINASRGMVVDDQALREHNPLGHIAGAALDVFPVEPKKQGDEFMSVLRGLDNVILTRTWAARPRRPRRRSATSWPASSPASRSRA